MTLEPSTSPFPKLWAPSSFSSSPRALAYYDLCTCSQLLLLLHLIPSCAVPDQARSRRAAPAPHPAPASHHCQGLLARSSQCIDILIFFSFFFFSSCFSFLHGQSSVRFLIAITIGGSGLPCTCASGRFIPYLEHYITLHYLSYPPTSLLPCLFERRTCHYRSNSRCIQYSSPLDRQFGCSTNTAIRAAGIPSLGVFALGSARLPCDDNLALTTYAYIHQQTAEQSILPWSRQQGFLPTRETLSTSFHLGDETLHTITHWRCRRPAAPPLLCTGKPALLALLALLALNPPASTPLQRLPRSFSACNALGSSEPTWLHSSSGSAIDRWLVCVSL